jgi:alpha-beta hydrolase superfamily lysophospholipase
MSDEPTKKADDADLELRPQYDFSRGVRGKYAARYREGSNVVVLDPDVAELFKTSEAVNEALREVARLRRAGGA